MNLRTLALRLVLDGPRLPPRVARALFDFGMGQRGVRVHPQDDELARQDARKEPK